MHDTSKVCVDHDPVSDITNRIMSDITVEDILEAAKGELVSVYDESFGGISIDSRTVKEGELFIALKGERFDGHRFVHEACKTGGGALIDRPLESPEEGKTIIQVEDTLRALQQIARHLRLKSDIPVIAVTGSNGKTTTKELIAAILGTEHRVLKNQGNLNNHIGLPLSITRIAQEDQMIVLEMGANSPNEIYELCSIGLPTIGVLTNIGQAHLEGFGDIATVRKTKLELLGFVDTVVVNADDLFLMEGVKTSGYRGRIVTYGIERSADVMAHGVTLLDQGSVFRIEFSDGQKIEVAPQIHGICNVYNILAAASIGQFFNIPLPRVKEAVNAFQGVPMRLAVKEMNGMKIISDLYNANPSSMEEAIKELMRIPHGRHIVVLGDMLELGKYSGAAHRKLGEFMAGLPVDIFIAVGSLMQVAASAFPRSKYTLGTPEDAGRILKQVGRKGDAVLIKGSRGMRMEKVLEGYAL
jgi:UDP-N-acetylmuramoyl-tripeptide--D-alanyl-D-alanine ligase